MNVPRAYCYLGSFIGHFRIFDPLVQNCNTLSTITLDSSSVLSNVWFSIESALPASKEGEFPDLACGLPPGLHYYFVLCIALYLEVLSLSSTDLPNRVDTTTYLGFRSADMILSPAPLQAVLPCGVCIANIL